LFYDLILFPSGVQELRADMRRHMAKRDDLIKEKMLCTVNSVNFDKLKESELNALNAAINRLEAKVFFKKKFL
jgi:hypothetical protein